jgi:hypothetical protein
MCFEITPKSKDIFYRKYQCILCAAIKRKNLFFVYNIKMMSEIIPLGIKEKLASLLQQISKWGKYRKN